MADRIPSSTNDLLEGKEEGSPPYNPCWYLLGVVVIILLIFPVICIPILFNQQEIYKSRFRAEVLSHRMS